PWRRGTARRFRSSCPVLLLGQTQHHQDRELFTGVLPLLMGSPPLGTGGRHAAQPPEQVAGPPQLREVMITQHQRQRFLRASRSPRRGGAVLIFHGSILLGFPPGTRRGLAKRDRVGGQRLARVRKASTASISQRTARPRRSGCGKPG